MNKQSTILVGVLFILLIVVGFWYWFGTTKADETRVLEISQQIKPVDANILTSKSMQLLNQKQIYGNIPVQAESDYNHIDIFN